MIRLSGWSDGGTTMVRLERDVERLVHDNQKLVHFQVSRYLQRYYVGDMEREDLVSWGLIGLVQAARAWDPARSGSFSTLASALCDEIGAREAVPCSTKRKSGEGPLPAQGEPCRRA